MALPNENVSADIQNEDLVSPQEEQNVAPIISQKEIEDNKEFNFKKLRESNKQLEERLKKSEEMIASLHNSSTEEEELAEEDLAEGKHLKKLETRIKNYIYQKELEAVPDKLERKFSDFNQVVTKENLEKLQKSEPELYKTISFGKDLFSKGVAAYKSIKAFEIAHERENFMKEKDQALSNSKKPMSTQSVKGQGALHEANAFTDGLTPELKKRLQKEMSNAIKSR